MLIYLGAYAYRHLIVICRKELNRNTACLHPSGGIDSRTDLEYYIIYRNMLRIKT